VFFVKQVSTDGAVVNPVFARNIEVGQWCRFGSQWRKVKAVSGGENDMSVELETPLANPETVHGRFIVSSLGPGLRVHIPQSRYLPFE